MICLKNLYAYFATVSSQNEKKAGGFCITKLIFDQAVLKGGLLCLQIVQL